MPVYVAQRRVEFSQTDMAGVAHFAEFFRFMESVEHEFLRENGLSVHQEFEGQVISWPRVSCGVDFRAPLFFEDQFEVRFGVERVGRKSVSFRAEFFKGQALCAEGRCTTVCCVLKGGRMLGIDMPPVYREVFENHLWGTQY